MAVTNTDQKITPERYLTRMSYSQNYEGRKWISQNNRKYFKNKFLLVKHSLPTNLNIQFLI